jgi:hypothetical protein
MVASQQGIVERFAQSIIAIDVLEIDTGPQTETLSS